MLEAAKRWASGREQSRQKSLPHGAHVLVRKDRDTKQGKFPYAGEIRAAEKSEGAYRRRGGGGTNPVNVFIMDRCVPYIRKCW